MQRYFLEIHYKGTNYHGWQIQPNAITVQAAVDKALATILRNPTETIGCGRTDTGVHSTQFFLHFDAEVIQDELIFLGGINALLPPDIAAKRLIKVEANAHARFDAVARTYEYHIYFTKNPFYHDYGYYLRDRPDIGLMNKGAKIIQEQSDFSCFSKSRTQVKTNICKITEAYWEYVGDQLIFTITADRFLRNMVRAIVGTLLDIGRNHTQLEDLSAILESKNRSNAGTSVPASGLFLTKVKYPYIN